MNYLLLKQYFYYFYLSSITRYLPRNFVDQCAAFFARIEYSSIRPNSRHLLMSRITAFKSLSGSSQSAKKISLEVIRHYIMNILELSTIATLKKRYPLDYIEVKGNGYIKEAVSQNKGVVIVGGHQAMFELNIAPFSWSGHRSALVYMPPMSQSIGSSSYAQQIYQYYESIRISELGYDAIHPDIGIKKAIRLLKDKGVVGIAIDFPDANRYVTRYFLGQCRRIPLGPAYLALQTGAVTLVSQLERISFGKNVLTLHPVLFLPKGKFDSDIASLTHILAAKFESGIYKNPQQWAWGMWIDMWNT